MGGAHGGGAGILTEEMIKQVIAQLETVVADPERAKQAEKTLAEMKSEIKGFNKTVTKSGKELGKLYMDHDAGTESMLTNLEAINSEWRAAQQKIMEQRFELKKSINAEEWAVMFSAK